MVRLSKRAVALAVLIASVWCSSVCCMAGFAVAEGSGGMPPCHQNDDRSSSPSKHSGCGDAVLVPSAGAVEMYDLASVVLFRSEGAVHALGEACGARLLARRAADFPGPFVERLPVLRV